MSLARLGMRIAAARALRNATLAEDRVFDSRIDPLALTAEAAGGDAAIIVTTDDHTAETDGRDMTGGDHTCDLVVEMVIAAQAQATGDNAGTPVEITIPHTDEGMELVLDLMEAQVLRRLSGGDGGWSSVWRAMVPRVVARISRRGASAENGARFAARQLVLSCDLVSDPVPGAAPGAETAFGRLLAAMDADAALAPVAQIMRAQIVDDRADWRLIADQLGIDEALVPSLGLGPMTGDPADDPAALTEIETSDGFVINQQSVDEQGEPDA